MTLLYGHIIFYSKYQEFDASPAFNLGFLNFKILNI